MANQLKRYAIIAWTRRSYVTRALVYLLQSRLAFSMLSIEAILAELTSPAGGNRPAVTTRRRADPKLVAWSIAACARRVPWRSDCLIQAMAAARWLRKSGYEPQLQLGIAPPESGPAPGKSEPFRAHAWLLLEGKPLIGGHAGEFVPFPLRMTHSADTADAPAAVTLAARGPQPADGNDST